MRQKHALEGIAVFVAVAEAGSFSAAAKRLGVSPSAASPAIRGLEERLGAPLLRLTMPRAPFDLLIAPVLVAFQEAYPDVELDIAVEARLVDIVKQGYDAGLRYGEFVEKDMVAVPVAPASEAILVAAPVYLHARPLPAAPRDLLDHRAVVCRSQASGSIKPWILQSGGETVQVAPPTITVVHDLASQIDLAIRGLGILSAPAASVAGLVDAGRLSRVLPACSSMLDAVYLYFPSRRHQSAALRAFVAFLKRR